MCRWLDWMATWGPFQLYYSMILYIKGDSEKGSYIFSSCTEKGISAGLIGIYGEPLHHHT